MKNKKAVSDARKRLKLRYWQPVRNQLREYLAKQGKGAACLISRFLQCEPSQIHRYTCPVCEHDAEPTYSTVMGILDFLQQWQKDPIALAKSLHHVPLPRSKEREAAEKRKAKAQLQLTQLPYSVIEAQRRAKQ